MVAAMLPLVYYHVWYLARRAKQGLLSSAIDSVYYFGFLLTIGALGVSAFVIASGAQAGIDVWKEVTLQFGLGLAATGYAVAARIHLLSIMPAFDGANAEEAVDRTVIRSQALVSNMEMAAARFETFASGLMERTVQTTERMRVQTEKSMRDTVHAFSSEMQAATASTHRIAESLRELVADESVLHRHVQLGEATLKLTEALNRIVPATEKFNDRMELAANATGELADWSGLLKAEISEVRGGIDSLSGKEGSLAHLSSSVSATAVELESRMAGLAGMSDEVSNLTVNLGHVTAALKTVATQSQRAGEKMTIFVQAGDEIEQNASRLHETIASMAKLADSARTLDTSIANVASAILPVADHFTRLAASTAGASDSLNHIRKNATDTTGAVAEVAKSIASLTRHMDELATLGAGLAAEGSKTAKTLSSVPDTGLIVAQLSTNLQVISQAAASVGEAVQKLDRVLAASAETVQLRIRTTSEDLARDVAASGQAVDMLTGKLVDIAQIIIDKTRQKVQK